MEPREALTLRPEVEILLEDPVVRMVHAIFGPGIARGRALRERESESALISHELVVPTLMFRDGRTNPGGIGVERVGIVEQIMDIDVQAASRRELILEGLVPGD